MRKELQRDQGLARLGRGTRWLTAGALASAGCLSIAVAETLPGRSSAAPRPATPATTPTSAHTATTPPTAATGNDGDADTDDGGSVAPAATAPPQTAAPQTLAPPTTPPTTAYNPPVVSSGGS